MHSEIVSCFSAFGQPYVLVKDVYKPISDAQTDVCAPKHMILARFFSMEDVFAFRRFQHNLQQVTWFGLQKDSSVDQCLNVSKVIGLISWITGEERADSSFFKEREFHLTSCSLRCFTATIVGNILSLEDISCSQSKLVVCMNITSSGELMCKKFSSLILMNLLMYSKYTCKIRIPGTVVRNASDAYQTELIRYVKNELYICIKISALYNYSLKRCNLVMKN